MLKVKSVKTTSSLSPETADNISQSNASGETANMEKNSEGKLI